MTHHRGHARTSAVRSASLANTIAVICLALATSPTRAQGLAQLWASMADKGEEYWYVILGR